MLFHSYLETPNHPSSVLPPTQEAKWWSRVRSERRRLRRGQRARGRPTKGPPCCTQSRLTLTLTPSGSENSSVLHTWRAGVGLGAWVRIPHSFPPRCGLVQIHDTLWASVSVSRTRKAQRWLQSRCPWLDPSSLSLSPLMDSCPWWHKGPFSPQPFPVAQP